MSDSGELSSHDNESNGDIQAIPVPGTRPDIDLEAPFISSTQDPHSCTLKLNTIDFASYLREGNNDEAIRELYQVNPLPHICNHACRGGELDGMHERLTVNDKLSQSLYEVITQTDHDVVIDIVCDNRSRFMTGRRVAIIGSGATALTAAFDLVTKGHHVVIYEAASTPGGSLREKADTHTVIADSLDRDIDVILSMGIDLRLNMEVGRHITMDKLRINFDAVLDTTRNEHAAAASEVMSDNWLWDVEDISASNCAFITQAIATGHDVAESIHDVMLSSMWKQA